jgi:Domain of unknown function (DUF397)
MCEWHRVPCSTNSCPEWRREERKYGEVVLLRSSETPRVHLVLYAAEWAALIAAAKNGDLDQDTP